MSRQPRLYSLQCNGKDCDQSTPLGKAGGWLMSQEPGAHGKNVVVHYCPSCKVAHEVLVRRQPVYAPDPW